MLSINGKKFMNLPEAVQWLLSNNALPFQCKANYVADTVIAKSDIINPSPAEIKVGSLVLFADSKVGTVSGVTDSGFMVGQDYTDIGSQLNQIVGIELDASQHLVFTMANGDTIDAGLVKELSGLSIDSSQHLIATYNDGSTTDLGAIFQGNVNIAGDFTADSIIENMSGYSFNKNNNPPSGVTLDYTYCGVVKNGNKITFVWALEITRTDTTDNDLSLGSFNVPSAIGDKLFPVKSSWLSMDDLYVADDYASGKTLTALTTKQSSTNVGAKIYKVNTLDLNAKYYVRYEKTFLLSNNLAA